MDETKQIAETEVFFDTGFFTPQINCGLFIAAMIIGVLGICAVLLQ